MTSESPYTVPLLINGKEVTTSTTFPVISPSSHQEIWHSSSASLTDANDAVAAAQAAFPAWSKTKPTVRRNIFLKAADILEQRADECAGYMMQETGADAHWAHFNMPLTAELLRDVAGRVSSIQGSMPVCDQEGTAALVVKEPWGVVLGIAPWNAPYILGVRSVLYALAAGNTCILKGSELCPRVFWAIGSVFADAGLPSGALNVLYHSRASAIAITTALIEHPSIKKINFTGSTAVGRAIAATAGRALKPVLLELGGKASAIVCADADVGKAAHQCALGAFVNAGQICMSTERILVHKDVKEEFVAKFTEAVKMVFGDDKPAPVVVMESAIARNKQLISDAVAAGAEILHGDHEKDERHPETREISKTRMRPIVVGGVSKDMELYHTESFGPSVSVIEVQDDEEAIAIANDTEYGLTGAVFTEDLKRGLRIARRVESGAVHINSMTIHDEPSLPHGGAKSSGWGRFNGSYGIDEFLRIKTITFQE